MGKVVYNNKFGGFSLSDKAMEYADQLGAPWAKDWNCEGGSKYKANNNYLDEEKYHRHDRFLVKVVEDLGDLASGSCSELKIQKVNRFYKISDYDGNETVHTLCVDDWIEILD